ncbi:MAG: glutamine amidotransferase family protein [Bacillota bacterium]|nr:glutamine amidotransferase family protein [Bacillota bacterium]
MQENYGRIPSGCAISGFINRDGRRVSGESIIQSIALMHDRSNGLGGGFAAYGIYPQFAEEYALHLMYDSERSREECEHFIADRFTVRHAEPIPTRHVPGIEDAPLLWRYFVRPREDRLHLPGRRPLSEDDFTVAAVMAINEGIEGAYVASSGKNMGAFKGVGFPEEIGRFYRLEEYEGYMWIAHGRFPTNTPGWWGGAHPFTILDWSVVHNGEISSYGINKRYLEMFGYRCALQTDTEVVAYLFDLLERRHGLPFPLVCAALAAPFWQEIDELPEEEREALTALRQVYGSALLNGPFSIIVGSRRGMVGLNDRIKLRPMVAAVSGDTVYLASEESAIIEICPQPDRVWLVRAGEPVVAELYAQAAEKARNKGAA